LGNESFNAIEAAVGTFKNIALPDLKPTLSNPPSKFLDLFNYLIFKENRLDRADKLLGQKA
jgi:hypothetical protein